MQKANLRQTFEAQIYGNMPDNYETTEANRRRIIDHSYPATIEEVVLQHPHGPDYTAVIVMPSTADDTIPIIMMENFCPNHNVL